MSVLSPPRTVPYPEAATAPARTALAHRALVLAALFKPKIAAFVIVATAAGFYLGAHGAVEPLRLAHALLGTALLSAAASALNQLAERGLDARMRRTRARPLPSGTVRPGEALFLGLALTALGLAELGLLVNPLSALLGALSLSSYLLLYTPLKRRTHLATLVGGVPGALPPVMGWAAATNDLGLEALALFAVLFLWQVPHFLAIARLHRDDYRRAGFPVLTVVDPDGTATGRAIIFNCAALVPAGLLPSYFGLTGPGSFFAALGLGLGFLGFGIAAALRPERGPARRLLLASLVYLPVLLISFMLDKV